MTGKKNNKEKDLLWHENQSEQQKLVNAINFHGFVLEDRVAEVIRGIYFDTPVKRGSVFLRPDNSERVEIDAWIKYQKNYFIFEVKSSAYDWVFLKGPSTDSNFHLILDNSKNGVHTAAFAPTGRHPFNSDVAEVGFEVLANRLQGSTELKIQPKGKKIVGDLNVPVGPDGREIIRPAGKQLFKNLETLAYHEGFEKSESSSRDTLDSNFLPVLVTNAPLFVAEYTKDGITQDGSLKALSSIKQVSWLAYNYPEILHWDTGLQSQIKHVGWKEEHTISRKDYSGSHIKSIFVVQYQKLGDFLREIA